MTQIEHPYGDGQPAPGQPPSGQAPYGQPPPPPPPAPGTSTLAVLALVFAFVVAPAGIVLGIMARRRIRVTGENGKGLATAGLVLGIIFTLAGVVAVVLTVVLVALVPRTLDTAGIQEKLVSSTTDAAGVAPTGLQCPTGVAAKAGTVFTCTAQLDGQPINYRVTEQDDKGNVTFSSETFVPLTKVESLVTDQVSKQAGTPATAQCDAGGKKVVLSVPGTVIACTVTNNGDATDSVKYTATITDTEGNLNLQPAG